MLRSALLVGSLALTVFIRSTDAQQAPPPTADGEEIVVISGELKLKALLFRPKLKTPAPAVLFHHGNGCGAAGPLGAPAARTLGARFADRGYVFLWVFRRGVGPSNGQGECAMTEINRVRAESGDDAAMATQLRLLTTTQLDDAMAGLAAVRSLPGVDTSRIIVGGHSFGGQLAVLTGELDRSVRAILVVAGAAQAWDRSADLRSRLIRAVGATKAPIYLGYAEDDDAAAGRALGAELSRLQKPHVLAVYPTGGHGFFWQQDHPSNKDVFQFLADVLK
jgi:dienelactone hydrolase